MLKLFTLQVVYSQRMKLTITDSSVKEAIKLLIETEPYSNYTPQTVTFKDQGKTLLFLTQPFKAFLAGDITEEQLIRELDITQFYRNIDQLLTDDEQVIDTGSLWTRSGPKLILVDEDRFIDADYNPKHFERYYD